MVRKRNGLVPAGEAFGGLDGPVKALRDDSRQARHSFTVDHVTPQSHGGTDHMDNLQLLCGACNSMKGTGTQAELIVKLQAQELR